MYLQITTKCNMRCEHCCYSCTQYGRHGFLYQIIDNIAFAREWTDSISIGGGEPTLHPDFFEILNYCLNDFDYVWMATNGSQTETMHRLANIINGQDFESFEREDYCECETEEEREDCYCEPSELIYQEDKLSVALSQDYYHDEIDQRIIDLWRRSAHIHERSHFEIRDVSQHVIEEGRAKKTGAGLEQGCVCASIIIKPTGKLRLCGCSNSPVIGHVSTGIEEHWYNIINNNEGFRGSNCHKDINNIWED